jgi:HRD ubiquitin ligase complex, ER membrane component
MSLSKVSFIVLIVIFAVFLFMYVIFKALERFAAVKQEEHQQQDEDSRRSSSVLVIVESAAFIGFCRDIKVRQAAIDHEIAIETFKKEMNCIEIVEQEQDRQQEEVLTAHEDDEQHDEEEQDEKSLHGKKVISSKKEQQMQSSAPAAVGNKNYSHINKEREEQGMQVHFLPPRGAEVGDREMATTTTTMMKKVNAAGADVLLVLGNKMPSSSPSFDSFKDNDDGAFGCAICLETILYGQKVAWSKNNKSCVHLFHEACLIMWLERKSDCPCCREILLPVDCFLEIYNSSDQRLKESSKARNCSSYEAPGEQV